MKDHLIFMFRNHQRIEPMLQLLFTMFWTIDTEEIVNAGNYSKIRVFASAQKPSDTPIEELILILQNSSIASPQSIGGPSWVYFSARNSTYKWS